MCLSGSVGTAGKAANKREDVRLIQMLLNANAAANPSLARVEESGTMNAATLAAIVEFQRTMLPPPPAIGLVTEGDATWLRLKEGLGDGLTREKFRILLYPAPGHLVDHFYPHIAAALEANEIDTPLRQAHFLAQLGHESGSLRYTEELASGAAYEGRVDLGNTRPGDGVRFKGRGLIQITGRANYTAYGKARNKDYTTEPNNRILATDPEVAVDCSCWFWKKRGINAAADRDDVKAVTRMVNGGLNGLDDRLQRTRRARGLLL